MDIIREACNVLKLVLQARAPYDTGNLALNSIRIVGNSVYIGGEIADYAIYTNEPWLNRPGKNPNEGWVQNAIKEAAPLIQRVLNGRATKKDIEQAKSVYAEAVKVRKSNMQEKNQAEIEKIKGAQT